MNTADKPSSAPKLKWIRAGAAALLGFSLLGAVLLQEHADAEAQARKTAAALAFERDPDSWLAHPKEASDFERAVATREVAAVAINGNLALYTDRHGRRFSGTRAAAHQTGRGDALQVARCERIGARTGHVLFQRGREDLRLGILAGEAGIERSDKVRIHAVGGHDEGEKRYHGKRLLVESIANESSPLVRSFRVHVRTS